MDVVSFLSRADSMWRSLAICAGLQCDLRQIAWYSASRYLFCLWITRTKLTLYTHDTAQYIFITNLCFLLLHIAFLRISPRFCLYM